MKITKDEIRSVYIDHAACFAGNTDVAAEEFDAWYEEEFKAKNK